MLARHWPACIENEGATFICDPHIAASWRSGQPLTFEQTELSSDRVFRYSAFTESDLSVYSSAFRNVRAMMVRTLSTESFVRQKQGWEFPIECLCLLPGADEIHQLRQSQRTSRSIIQISVTCAVQSDRQRIRCTNGEKGHTRDALHIRLCTAESRHRSACVFLCLSDAGTASIDAKRNQNGGHNLNNCVREACG